MTSRARSIAITLAALAAAALAACSSAASSSDSAPMPRVRAAQAVADAPECATQVADWAAAEQALGTDSATLRQALGALETGEDLSGVTAADTSAVTTAAASVQSDATAVEAGPGPSCVPETAAGVSAGAQDYSAAAIDADSAVGQLSAGDMEASVVELQSADSAMDKGNSEIAAATKAVKTFSAGSGS